MLQLLKKTCGRDALGHTQCYERIVAFKSTHESIEGHPRPERPSTLTDDIYIQKVKDLVRANRRQTVRELVEEEN